MMNIFFKVHFMVGWPGTHIYFFNFHSLQVHKHHSRLQNGFLLPVTSNPTPWNYLLGHLPFLVLHHHCTCCLHFSKQLMSLDSEPNSWIVCFVSLQLGIFTSTSPKTKWASLKFPNRRLLRCLASPWHNFLLLQTWDPQKRHLGSVPPAPPGATFSHSPPPPSQTPHTHFNTMCSETCRSAQTSSVLFEAVSRYKLYTEKQ